jgi:hypothetical protein
MYMYVPLVAEIKAFFSTMKTIISHLSFQPEHPTPPQPPITPETGDPDPENDESLFVYGTDSDAEDEAAKR